MKDLINPIVAFISGGLLLEIFKFLWPDLKQIFSSRIEAKKTFYKNLDPLLKSASELYGKIESLAREDFSTFINPLNSNSKDPEQNKKYVYYLFAQLWAHLEYLRLESQYTSLSKIEKGNQLLRFIETIESREFRILDRSIQRIIGECLILKQEQKFRVMTLNEFFEDLDDTNSRLKKWIDMLDSSFSQLKIQENRQIILRFGIVVASFIDHFDPDYLTVRRRDIYINKLSKKSKGIIRYRLLNHYLHFLKFGPMYYEA